MCVPDSLVLKDRHPSDRALLVTLLFHKPLHSPDTLHFEVDISSKLYIPLLYLGSRDHWFLFANLGGNAEVWLPQVIELPVLRYPCLEISPDLGAESGVGHVVPLILSLLGLWTDGDAGSCGLWKSSF